MLIVMSDESQLAREGLYFTTSISFGIRFAISVIKRGGSGQQLYHARAEQLGELGLPGCDEALGGMGGASLTNEVPGVM